MRRALFLIVAMTWPAAALACAVCGADNDRNRLAFLGTTILLSLVPLSLIGGALLYLRRVAGARLAGEFDEREDAIVEGTARDAAPAQAARGSRSAS